MDDKFYKPKTLCWDCDNATGGCSWSEHMNHTPVKGWYAVRNDIKTKEGTHTESYIVISCPEFVRDAREGGMIRKKVKNVGQTA